MKYVFLPEAEEDIDRLYEFLIDKNPLAAQKAMLAIEEGVELLLDSPYMGVKMKDRPEYRQLFCLSGKAYMSCVTGFRKKWTRFLLCASGMAEKIENSYC